MPSNVGPAQRRQPRGARRHFPGEQALLGLAAMLNGGMLGDAPPLDELVAGVAEQLVLGLRPRGAAPG